MSLHPLSQQLRWIARHTRRLAIVLAGFAVLGAGLAMLVLPGPGVVVILLGLAILATELAWAERALDRAAATAAAATSTVTGNRAGQLTLAASATTMIVGGALVAVLLAEHRLIGMTVVLAGLIALAALVPRVQRWIDRRAGSPTASPPTADALPPLATKEPTP